MLLQESKRKRERDRNTSIPEFGNRDIPFFEVNLFSQVDQAEGSDGEKEYRYHKESDIDELDDYAYNGLTMDETLAMFVLETMKKKREAFM